MTLEELMGHIEKRTVLTSTAYSNTCGIPTGFEWTVDDVEISFADVPDQHLLKDSEWSSLNFVGSGLETLAPMSKKDKDRLAAALNKQRAKLAQEERTKAIVAVKLKEALESRKLSKIFDLDQIEALVATLPKVLFREVDYKAASNDAYLYLTIDTGNSYSKNAMIITGTPYNRKFALVEQRLLSVEVEDA